jgi:acid phosphatase type 7
MLHIADGFICGVMQADSMVIGWLTNSSGTPPIISQSAVQFGTAHGDYTSFAHGSSSSYSYDSYTSGQIHHVALTGLAPNTKYYFHVGEPGVEGTESHFSSNPGPASPAAFPFSLSLVGDVGLNSDGTRGQVELVVVKLAQPL